MKKMVTRVWKRVKVNICELCGRVMDVGEEYVLHMITGEDACKNCASRMNDSSLAYHLKGEDCCKNCEMLEKHWSAQGFIISGKITPERAKAILEEASSRASQQGGA